jgi:hypothetical protein
MTPRSNDAASDTVFGGPDHRHPAHRAPTAAADQQSFYDSLHAQGITSSMGDQALFNAGTRVCKDTAFYIRYAATGDFSAHAAKLPKTL